MNEVKRSRHTWWDICALFSPPSSTQILCIHNPRRAPPLSPLTDLSKLQEIIADPVWRTWSGGSGWRFCSFTVNEWGSKRGRLHQGAGLLRWLVISFIANCLSRAADRTKMKFGGVFPLTFHWRTTVHPVWIIYRQSKLLSASDFSPF